MLALSALEMGHMPVAGATGGVLRRSLEALKRLTDDTISEIRSKRTDASRIHFTVAGFLSDAAATARLDPNAAKGGFSVKPVDSRLRIAGDRGLLSAALGTFFKTHSSSPRRMDELNYGRSLRASEC